MLSAVDAFKALHHASGVRNSKASVIDVDSSQSSISGPNILAVNSYHSVKFNEKSMKLHRYFNIGKGNIVQYSDETKFSSSIQIKEDFHATSSISGKSRKKNNSAKTLFFCPDLACTKVFEKEIDFENHLLQGNHETAKETSATDKVRSSFVKKNEIILCRASDTSQHESYQIG